MVVYVLVYIQPGGWEITHTFVERETEKAIYNAFVLPFATIADRVYKVYADDTCDILKGDR